MTVKTKMMTKDLPENLINYLCLQKKFTLTVNLWIYFTIGYALLILLLYKIKQI